MAAVASPRSPLGALSCLPAEIRCVIWQKCWPQPASLPSQDALAILRTSHQIRAELIGEIYNTDTLDITIAPSQSSWASPRTRLRAPWSQDPWYGPANEANFDKAAITIYPAHSDNPGEIVRSRSHVLSLLAFLTGFHSSAQKAQLSMYSDRVHNYSMLAHQLWLGSAERMGREEVMPAMTVRVVGEAENWCARSEKGPLQQYGRWHTCSNLEYVLGPFAFLRNVPQIEFTGPAEEQTHCSQHCGDDDASSPPSESVALKQDIRQWMVSSTRHIHKVRATEAIRTVELEMVLDRMSGFAAQELRTKRLRRRRDYSGDMRRIDELAKPILPKKGSARVDGALRARFRGSGGLAVIV